MRWIRRGALSWLTLLCTSLAVQAHEGGALAEPEGGPLQVSAFYLFRSWERPDRMVMLMSVARGQTPAEGPDYVRFADGAIYRFGIDNDLNGVAANVAYEIRFETEQRPVAGGYPWPYVSLPSGPDSTLHGITALDGEGSQGLTIRQSYTVTQVTAGGRTPLFRGQKLIATPPNVGPVTMPRYEELAAQGIYSDPTTSIRVFAGPRAETAYRDAGALFDAGGLRRNPPFLTEAEDNDNQTNPFGVNRFRGANVLSIAIEVPISLLTRDGKDAASTAIPALGAYASIFKSVAPRDRHHGAAYRQVSRMGNPSFRQFIVDTQSKTRWDAARPEDDAQFQELLKAPAIATLLQSSFGVPVPPVPRVELVSIILKYPNQPLSGSDCGMPCSDLLRINLQVPPTPAEQQHRLGALLSPDLAGLPNGCRPNDDITDISLRAFGGPAYFAARIGDGVNAQSGLPGTGMVDGPGYGAITGNRLDVAPNGVVAEFPFMPTPYSGVDSQ